MFIPSIIIAVVITAVSVKHLFDAAIYQHSYIGLVVLGLLLSVLAVVVKYTRKNDKKPQPEKVEESSNDKVVPP